MAIPTATLEREQLLKLAEEYRGKGYDVSFHPNSEDLPDFLRNYRPGMIVRRGDEAVIVEVKSRSSLDSSSTELRHLAQLVEQHPGWRLELVMTNSEDATTYFPKAESSLQESEIESRLQVARQLTTQHLESAILYTWSLVEATLRLVAEHEGLSLQRSAPLYLVKQLVAEGIISRSEYQLLMDTLSLRNDIAHGFKTTQLTREYIDELINITEQLLKALHCNPRAEL
jgi:uncharacterized protein YutE (UPF0331/DUF86 family)